MKSLYESSPKVAISKCAVGTLVLFKSEPFTPAQLKADPSLFALGEPTLYSTGVVTKILSKKVRVQACWIDYESTSDLPKGEEVVVLGTSQCVEPATQLPAPLPPKKVVFRAMDGSELIELSPLRFQFYDKGKPGGCLEFSTKERASAFLKKLRMPRKSSPLDLKEGCKLYDLTIEKEMPHLRVSGTIVIHGLNLLAFQDDCVFICADSQGGWKHPIIREVTVVGSATITLHRASLLADSRLCLGEPLSLLPWSVLRNSSLRTTTSLVIPPWVTIDDMKVSGAADTPVFFSGVGTESATLSVYRGKGGELRITRGCFNGDEDAFLEAVKQKPTSDPWRKLYPALLKQAKAIFSVRESLEKESESTSDLPLANRK